MKTKLKYFTWGMRHDDIYSYEMEIIPKKWKLVHQ